MECPVRFLTVIVFACLGGGVPAEARTNSCHASHGIVLDPSVARRTIRLSRTDAQVGPKLGPDVMFVDRAARDCAEAEHILYWYGGTVGVPTLP